jgi:hypothetical protein
MPQRRTKSKARHKQLSDAEWLVVRDLFEAGGMSNRQIAAHFENRITEAAVRARAKRDPNDIWQKFDVHRTEIVRMALEPRLEGDTPKSPDSARSDAPSDSANSDSSTPPPIAETVVARGADRPSSQAYAQVRSETMRPRTLRNLQREAQQDLDDMARGLLNAQSLLALIDSEVNNLIDRSQCIGMSQSDDPDAGFFGVDAKRINDLAAANGRAIEQIRKIRGMDEAVPDEISSLKVLVDAGWLPPELLVEALKRFQALKPSLRADFRSHYTLQEGAEFEKGSVLQVEIEPEVEPEVNPEDEPEFGPEVDPVYGSEEED